MDARLIVPPRPLADVAQHYQLGRLAVDAPKPLTNIDRLLASGDRFVELVLGLKHARHVDQSAATAGCFSPSFLL